MAKNYSIAMQKAKEIPAKKIGLIIAILIALGILIVGGFWFFNKQKSSSNQTTAESEIKDLTEKVGKLMDLPKDEAPAVATVSDVSKLEGQDFFKNAKNGDKVLAYTKNKKAIIYRPSENKIIEVAFYNPPVADNPVSSGSAQQDMAGTKATPTSAAKVSVVVYNGTKTAGLAKSKGSEISSDFDQVEITSTGNASGDFEETLVVDISGKNKTLVGEIAKKLNGKVGAMPSGETKPSSDILVIIGSK
ncbi:MAG: LytR family transcriptional regulator [Candidatus Moraniibacteriota bacterium]|nr:MAG: LytR family transcriptional regulator [Candidatus Moranbacteria bacterium]